MTDNIAAIATASGIGAIAVIRVSGSSCITEVSKVFSKDLTKLAQNTTTVGNIILDGEIIDQVVIAIFKAPFSYTGEDTIEISTHGGVLIREQVLSTLLTQNIRLAEHGEFTKRAYLNGKLDLIQAEAIQELIMAESKLALTISKNGLFKNTIKPLNAVLSELLSVITKIEVNIDYPEYEEENSYLNQEIIEDINKIIKKLNVLTNKGEKTILLTKGINCSIIGTPNSGKSSLLNRLCQSKKAIVSDIAGTTRDLVETRININGVLINLIDTAGIRRTSDTIEKEGVKLALSQIKKSKLTLLVLDGSKELTDEDNKLLKLTKNKNRILVINKNDISGKLDPQSLPKPHVIISCKTGKGINELRANILKYYELDDIQPNDLDNLFSYRQLEKVKRSIKHLLDAKNILSKNESIELISTSLMQGYQELLEITGKQYDADLEKNLFSKFCLGK